MFSFPSSRLFFHLAYLYSFSLLLTHILLLVPPFLPLPTFYFISCVLSKLVPFFYHIPLPQTLPLPYLALIIRISILLFGLLTRCLILLSVSKKTADTFLSCTHFHFSFLSTSFIFTPLSFLSSVFLSFSCLTFLSFPFLCLPFLQFISFSFTFFAIIFQIFNISLCYFLHPFPSFPLLFLALLSLPFPRRPIIFLPFLPFPSFTSPFFSFYHSFPFISPFFSCHSFLCLLILFPSIFFTSHSSSDSFPCLTSQFFHFICLLICLPFHTFTFAYLFIPLNLIIFSLLQSLAPFLP